MHVTLDVRSRPKVPVEQPGPNGRSRGRIHTLLAEAENERMHLMTFVHIARPTGFERLLILPAQVAFYNLFFLRYLLSPRTAHRVTGYFEEERRQSSIRRRPGFVIRKKPAARVRCGGTAALVR